MRDERKTTTLAKVEVYETTAPLLNAMYQEVRELAKKKPDATLNANKVTMINRLLVDIKEMLADESDSKYLDVLSDDDLPQNSDVVLVLSQYSASLAKFHSTPGYNAITGTLNAEAICTAEVSGVINKFAWRI